jgi:hypothetical protein
VVVHEAVLSVMCLWGSHFSTDTNSEVKVSERDFLAHALYKTGRCITVMTSDSVLQNIQALVMLAYYFFHTGKFTLGRYHSTAAVAIVLKTGLPHIGGIPSALEATPFYILRSQAGEEVQRLDAFWSVFTLNNQ